MENVVVNFVTVWTAATAGSKSNIYVQAWKRGCTLMYLKTVFRGTNCNQNYSYEAFKDVRANCFCASLLHTQIHMPRHASSTRAKY